MLSLIRLLVLITSAVSIATAQRQGLPSNPNCSRNNNAARDISRRQEGVVDRIRAELKDLLSLIIAINLIARNDDECQCEPDNYWVDVYNEYGLNGEKIQAIL